MGNDIHISPKLLHKSDAVDVLLCNPRPVAPLTLPLKSEAVASPPNGVEELLSYYAADESGGRIFSGLSPLMHQAQVASGTMRPSKSGSVPYQHLLQAFSTGLPSVEKMALDSRVEGLLELYQLPIKATSFDLINAADHYFFYKKPHEHVPGIMLLEAARQTIYYQLYTHTGHQLGDVTVSLSALNARFHSYAEIMFPIEVLVEDVDWKDASRPSVVRYLTSFYQRGRLLAEIESTAPVISLKRFLPARNAYLIDKEEFAPLPTTPITAIVTSVPGDAQIASVLRVSALGVTTAPVTQVNPGSYIFTLIYEGSICFSSEIEMHNVNASVMEWRFVNLAYHQLEILKEIIKRGFIIDSAFTHYPLKNRVSLS